MPFAARTGSQLRCTQFVTAVLALFASVLSVAASSVHAAAPKHPATPPACRLAECLIDTSGAHHPFDSLTEGHVSVLFFLSSACPLSDRYSRQLSRVCRAYHGRGVQFLGVHAGAAESLGDIARHARDFRLCFPVYKDDRQGVTDRLQARVTPEAFLLDAEGALRYRGCIDGGGSAPGAGAAEPGGLEAGLQEVLAGKTVTVSVTRAAGCCIQRAPRPVSNPTAVTYHRDVEPILQERCQSCHRPDQVAPFALLTYAEVRAHLDQIRRSVRSRQMPPWLAEPGHGEFDGPRRLRDAELKTLTAWIDAGAPEGDARHAPPARHWAHGWALGEPDLVLSLPEPYSVAADGSDEFRVFVLPTDLAEDRQVVAIDYQPGNPRVVHHLVTLVDTTGKGRELDAEEPGPGYSSGPGGARVPAAVMQGLWTPGNRSRFLPDDVGRLLPKGADLLLQVHYHKTGKPETDQTKVGLYFAKKPVSQIARTVVLGGWRDDIPAGAARHEVRFSSTLPSDVHLLTIMPHMHYLGKAMRVTATLPGGAHRDLVWIPRWDYLWQEAYRFREPVALPRGTRVEVVAAFDNSAANPRNPNHPPRAVQFGELTGDEMASVIFEGVVDPPVRLGKRPRAAASSR